MAQLNLHMHEEAYKASEPGPWAKLHEDQKMPSLRYVFFWGTQVKGAWWGFFFLQNQ